jgi:hypothetical protein
MIHELEATEEGEQTERIENEIYGNPERARTLLTRVINRWTTLPAPTEQTWRAATDQDPDLRKVLANSTTGTDTAEQSKPIKQTIPQRMETGETGTRKWDRLPTQRTQGNLHPTTEMKSSTPNSQMHNLGSLPHHSISRTYRILQDILEDSSTILVARHEHGRERSGTEMWALQISERYKPRGSTNTWRIDNRRTIQRYHHRRVVPRENRNETTTTQRQGRPIPESDTNLPLYNDRICLSHSSPQSIQKQQPECHSHISSFPTVYPSSFLSMTAASSKACQYRCARPSAYNITLRHQKNTMLSSANDSTDTSTR